MGQHEPLISSAETPAERVYSTYDNDDPNDTECIAHNRHVERLIGWKPRLLEEISRERSQSVATQNLDAVAPDSNHGSTKSNSPEASNVTGSSIGFVLVLDCDSHQSNALVNIKTEFVS